MKHIIKFLRWVLSLPFAIIETVFTFLWALSPIVKRLTVLVALIFFVLGLFKMWWESGDYLNFAEWVICLLALFFSDIIFSLLMKLFGGLKRLVRWGGPFILPKEIAQSEPVPQQPQTITLTAEQFRELIDRK